MSDTSAANNLLEQNAEEIHSDQNVDRKDLPDKQTNFESKENALKENASEVVNNEEITNPKGVEYDDHENEDDDIEKEDNYVEKQKDDENEAIEVEKIKDDEVVSNHAKAEKKDDEIHAEEKVEEEQLMEEPPPDPAAPLNLSDSKEDIKPPFELRPDQLAEVEQLWELYQDYTPVYTDIKGYITQKELVYLLKCLLLMTYTEEQLQELITYCVRPPDPNGNIKYEQFLKMVTIRQRDFPIEEELRSALQVLDPGKTGQVEREYLKDVLRNYGNKMPDKQLNNLIKEVDMSNDGQIGIEDVVGTMGIDLNTEDLDMLKASLNPPEENITEEF